MPIIRSSQSRDGAFIDSCWSLWQRMTLRPDSRKTDSAPESFVKAVTAIMYEGFDRTDVSNAVIYAAYLKPGRDRREDAIRVVRVLSDTDMMNRIYRLSLKLDNSGITLDEHLGHGVVSYPGVDLGIDGEANDEFTPGAGSAKIAELAKVLGTSVRYWPDDEMDYAIELVSDSNYTKAALRDAVDEVRSITGMTGVLPRDIIRALGPAGFVRDTPYGVVERSDMHDILGIDGDDGEEHALSLDFLPEDDMAMAMIRDGVPQEKVARFHHLAPTGYWKALSDAQDNGMSKKEAVAAIADEFGGFKPSHRKREE